MTALDIELDGAEQAVAAMTPPTASQRMESFVGAQDRATRALHAHLRRSAWHRIENRSPLETCLCALILAAEPHIEITRVVEAMTPDVKRLDLVDCLNTMINIGYRGRAGTIRPAEIDQRLLPCLFLPEGERNATESALVILSRKETPEGQVLTIFDGSQDASYELPVDDPEAGSAGRVYFFRPARRDEEATSTAARQHSGKNWFSAVLSQFHGTFWQLFAVSMTLSMVGLGTPLFIMLVYDRVIAPRTTEPLSFLAVGVALAIGMEWILRLLRSHSLSWLTARLDFVVGTSIFERLIQLPPAQIERASTSAQIARVKTFEAVRDFFSGPVFMSLIELPSIVVSIAAIAWFGGSLVLVPLVVALGYVVVFWLVRRKVMVTIRQAAKATSATQQFALETFEKIQAIRGNGLSDVWGRKYNDLSGRENLAQFRLYMLGTVGESAAHALTMVAATATLAFGVELIWDGSITTGTLVASMILTWRVLSPLHNLCTVVPRFEQLRNSILQINDLMDMPIEGESEEVSARLPQIKGQVTFSGVGLRYSREAGPVFLGLNAEVKPGEIVVIIGASGAGKSSILKLIQGLYPPVAGTLRIDGFDNRQLVQHDLRRLIAYVPQQPDLVAGTIGDNLRYARPLASDDELMAMLAEVGVSSEIEALPDGLATQVDAPEIAQLSSGALYRLAFARALLLDSPLILIDEQPNAVLNGGVADLVKRVLQSARGRSTVFLVSHRVDLMRLADRAIALRRGHTPVIGPIDSVMELAT